MSLKNTNNVDKFLKEIIQHSNENKGVKNALP